MSVNDTDIDDGFTPEERAAFDAMRADTSAPAAPGGGEGVAAGEGDDAGDGAGAADGEGAADGAAAVDGDHDDGDDHDDAGAAATAAGQDHAAAGAEGEGAARTPRRVSYSRFKRLQDEAAELRAKLGEKDVNFAKVEERLKIINEALTSAMAPATKPPTKEEQAAAAAADDPMPDPEADLFGYNQWLLREMNRRDERNAKAIEQLQAGRDQDVGEREFTQSYLRDSQAFAAKEPNFVPAYQYLMQSRTVELAEYFFGKDLFVAGTTLTDAEMQKISATVAAEERQLVQTALQNKQSPAQRIFNLARSRGYRPESTAAASQTDGKPGAKSAGNGKPAAAAATAVPGSLGEEGPAPGAGRATPNVGEEIARIRSGSEAALSLSDGGGSPGHVPLTAQRLASMNEDEFNATVERLSPQEWQRLAGG